MTRTGKVITAFVAASVLLLCLHSVRGKCLFRHNIIEISLDFISHFLLILLFFNLLLVCFYRANTNSGAILQYILFYLKKHTHLKELTSVQGRALMNLTKIILIDNIIVVSTLSYV